MIRCLKCNLEKDEDRFNWRNKSQCLKDKYCRDCRKIIQTNWYHKSCNKSKHILNVSINSKRYYDRFKKNKFEYLSAHPCVDCGEKDPIVLEFDHRDEKDKTCCIALLRSHSWDVVLKEIEKCDVRCANCHRRRTAKQFNWNIVV